MNEDEMNKFLMDKLDTVDGMKRLAEVMVEPILPEPLRRMNVAKREGFLVVSSEMAT